MLAVALSTMTAQAKLAGRTIGALCMANISQQLICRKRTRVAYDVIYGPSLRLVIRILVGGQHVLFSTNWLFHSL